jgi:hypothetical protein
MKTDMDTIRFCEGCMEPVGAFDQKTWEAMDGQCDDCYHENVVAFVGLFKNKSTIKELV